MSLLSGHMPGAALERQVHRIRADFPYLQPKRVGKRVVYLDNAATSQKPIQVLDAVSSYYRWENANPHRGAHYLTVQATQAYEEGRSRLAAFLGAGDAREIVFVRNATEAINLVAYAWALDEITNKDRIVITALEHHSNMVPWQFVSQKTGAELVVVPMTDDFTIDMEAFYEALTPNAKLVAVTGASNTTSTMPDVCAMTAAAHEVGARVLVDAAQLAAHAPVDVTQMDCDFLALSGHKMLAPMGIGALYAKMELLEQMQPFLYGGDMIEYVYEDHSTYAEVPMKFEAGTQNVGGVVGLSAAIDYLDALGMDNVFAYEHALTSHALDELKKLDFIDLYFARTGQTGSAITFNIKDIHPHDVATIMDARDVAVRSGHHCAMPFHTKLCLAATCRASFSFYNTKEEVDAFIDALHGVREVLGYGS